MDNAMGANQQLLVFDSGAELYDTVARRISELATDAVSRRGRFFFALAGGDTPRPLYRRLANEPEFAHFPWQHTHLFWGDERAVPPNDPQSNFGMAAQEMLHTVPIPESNIYRIPGELGAPAAARAYAGVLQRMADSGLVWPRFDVALLGLGPDGHTASLFPGSTHPSRSGQATLAVTGSYEELATSRITLTPPVFNSAHNVFFLVLGEQKADILFKVLEGDNSPVQFPARRINPEQGKLIWYVDRAAASKLSNSSV